MWKKTTAGLMTILMAGSLMAGNTALWAEQNDISKEGEQAEAFVAVKTALDPIDMTKWQYQADDDVYYQIGISYCENPADLTYETLAVFVPGKYFTASDNGDGTYTCEINAEAELNGYTAETAPIVIPIETPGYTAQAALTSYTNVTEYTDQGFVYVHAGCRGRDQGAPAGVTDLKAAIRYLRYSDGGVPGDTERIFVFGMSGGGAQSALVGATGDSDLYTPYLEQIGAVEGVSDAVYGSMDWCPITNLDSADSAYEWMMGSTRTGLSEEEQALSDALAAAFAEYVNEAGIQDPEGNILTLEESEDGIYQAGSYYDYILGVIEESLNNFLADTQFPYNAASSGGKMGGFGGGNFGGFGGPGREDGENFGGFGGPGGEGGENFGGFGGPGEEGGENFGGFGGPGGEGGENFGGFGGPGGEGGENFGGFGGPNGAAGEPDDQITRTESENGISLSGTYETAQDYIDALNANGEWVTYDIETNTASVSSVEAFVKAFKNASKNLGAFDQLDGGQGENILFGYGDGSGAHFDTVLAEILEEQGSSYASEYAEDLEKTDLAGYTAQERLHMYTPLYYLLESEEGYGTSTPAKYWRIRTGIAQSDTSVTTEVNLALALENYEGVESVDFETVWGQQHVKAERTGDSTANFIAWVHECMTQQ